MASVPDVDLSQSVLIVPAVPIGVPVDLFAAPCDRNGKRIAKQSHPLHPSAGGGHFGYPAQASRSASGSLMMTEADVFMARKCATTGSVPHRMLAAMTRAVCEASSVYAKCQVVRAAYEGQSKNKIFARISGDGCTYCSYKADYVLAGGGLSGGGGLSAGGGLSGGGGLSSSNSSSSSTSHARGQSGGGSGAGRIRLHQQVKTPRGFHKSSTTFAIFDRMHGLCFKCHCKKLPCNSWVGGTTYIPLDEHCRRLLFGLIPANDAAEIAQTTGKEDDILRRFPFLHPEFGATKDRPARLQQLSAYLSELRQTCNQLNQLSAHYIVNAHNTPFYCPEGLLQHYQRIAEQQRQPHPKWRPFIDNSNIDRAERRAGDGTHGTHGTRGARGAHGAHGTHGARGAHGAGCSGGGGARGSCAMDLFTHRTPTEVRKLALGNIRPNADTLASLAMLRDLERDCNTSARRGAGSRKRRGGSGSNGSNGSSSTGSGSSKRNSINCCQDEEQHKECDEEKEFCEDYEDDEDDEDDEDEYDL